LLKVFKPHIRADETQIRQKLWISEICANLCSSVA
jgi:hypothetical protein